MSDTAKFTTIILMLAGVFTAVVGWQHNKFEEPLLLLHPSIDTKFDRLDANLEEIISILEERLPDEDH